MSKRKQRKKRQPSKTASDGLMGRTRAAVAYLNAGNTSRPGEAMYAFLSVLHPELSHADKLKLIRTTT